MVSHIERIQAREVLDSRGCPTLEVEVHAGGKVGRAMVPSGASRGQAEALELRDGDPARYDGRGVLQAVSHVNTILGPALQGTDPTDQTRVDQRLLQLDPTPQKTRLGGNSLLGVSLAAAHAAAEVRGLPLYRHLHTLFAASQPPRLPMPLVNMISGGLHAGGQLEFQDVQVVPHAAPDYRTALEWAVRIYRRLGELLAAAGYEGHLVGDEGGYGPRLPTNRHAVEFVLRAIEAAGLQPGEQVRLAIDVAASQFYRDGAYHLATESARPLTSNQLIDLLESWVGDYPIASLEDGLSENDWSGWQQLTARLGHRVRLIGDDLLATSPTRVQQAIERRAANSVLVKVNQIGTLSETFTTMRCARQAGWTLVVSARSGETEDTTIADLAVATAAEHIKIGAVARSERLAKYNRLLRIEEALPAP